MALIKLSKPLIVIAIVVATLLGGLIAALFFSQKPPARPEPIVTPSSTPSNVPSARPGADPRMPPEPSEEKDGTSDTFNQNPILYQLPKFTPYWTLKISGSPKQTPLKLTAEVYYAPGADSRSVTESQKPYIEAFIKSTNQADGSYKIEYDSKLVERD